MDDDANISLATSDVNGDGDVDSCDALLILRRYLYG